MRVRSLLVLVCWAALSASAQTTNLAATSRSLSLRECLDLALARNLGLQISRLSIAIAGYSLNGSYGFYVPNFSFLAQHDHLDMPGDFDPKKTGSDLPYQLDNNLFESSLSGKTPIGLSYGFTASTREDKAVTDFSAISNASVLFPDGIRTTNNYFSEAKVALQQHLLKDFWIDAGREQIQLRRKDLSISQQATRFEVMKTVLAVELTYYDLLAARENVQVQEKALGLRQQLLAETRRRVELGDLPPLDAEQAETQLENTLTALASARELVAILQNTLASLISDNFQEWANVDLQPSDRLLAVPTEFNRSESFLSAMHNRPDLAEARLEVEKNEVVVRFRKNQLFPNLDLVGSYGGLGIAGSQHQSINNSLDFENPEYSYGVVLTMPLYNLGERNAYRASKAGKELAQLQLKKAEQDVLFQIADFVNRAQSRWSQVNSTHKAKTYAESALQAEQKKLQNGLTTAFVVLQYQEILTSARTAELQAMADYNKIRAQLAFADGSILERHNLALEVK